MKLLINIISAIFILASNAAADNASHREAAEELLITMKTDQMMKPMFEQLVKIMDNQFAQMDISEEERPLLKKYTSKMLKLMEEEVGWDKMKDDYIKVYAETYTEEELKAITSFYKTPAGQKFIEKMPLLMKKSMEISQKNMPDMINRMQQIQAEMFNEMQAEINKKHTEEENKDQKKEL